MASISAAVVIFRKHNWKFVLPCRESLLPTSKQSVAGYFSLKQRTRESVSDLRQPLTYTSRQWPHFWNTKECYAVRQELTAAELCLQNTARTWGASVGTTGKSIHSCIHTAHRHYRKTMSWTQILEDAYCSVKKERKQRGAEACVVNCLPGYKKGE